MILVADIVLFYFCVGFSGGTTQIFLHVTAIQVNCITLQNMETILLSYSSQILRIILEMIIKTFLILFTFGISTCKSSKEVSENISHISVKKERMICLWYFNCIHGIEIIRK